MTLVRVFYEDRAAGPIKGFGPHLLPEEGKGERKKPKRACKRRVRAGK